MAMQVADLEAVLKLNDKDYKKDMQEAENQSKKSLDSISNSSNNMSKNVSQNILSMGNIVKIAFAKLAYEGTQAFIGLGKAAINYTSDLKELENVLSVTFGDRMNAIALNADAMGRAMGRSSLQMRGAVAQAGALGKGLGFVGEDLEQMSLKLAQTAVDLGSFFNVADEEAFTALRAGLIGRICLA